MKLFKRKPKVIEDRDQVARAIDNVATTLRSMQNTPIMVNHKITRNIPKPARLIVWAENSRGQRYHMGYLDMSYKFGAPFILNIGMIMDDPSVPPVLLYMEAQYDQKDN